MSLKLQAEYVCDNGDFVNMVQEVTGKEYNDCCQIVANDGMAFMAKMVLVFILFG